jgi:hypothetical protein
MNPEILKKILQYAPEPPVKVWEGISKILDENNPGDLADKLQNFTAIPPAATWQKIEEKLNHGKTGILVKSQRFFTMGRAIAAAAIVIIATASILFWNREGENAFVAGPSTPAAPDTNSSSAQGNSGSGTQKNITIDSENPGADHGNKQASLVRNYRPGRQPASNNKSFAHSSMMAVHSFIPNKAQEKAIAVSTFPTEKYMVYSDDNGNAIRVPKKIFELISCVKEEIVCQEQIQQMQSRFASYVTTNDFTGLMEMLRNLKENN